jgi:hypothetical protein
MIGIFLTLKWARIRYSATIVGTKGNRRTHFLFKPGAVAETPANRRAETVSNTLYFSEMAVPRSCSCWKYLQAKSDFSTAEFVFL